MNKYIKYITDGFWVLKNGLSKKRVITYLCCYILLIPATPLLWVFLFMWIPSQSMVKIEGYVEESRTVYTSGRFAGTVSYNIKLKDINSPLYFVISRSRTIGEIKDIKLKEGDYIVTDIKEKDIERLKQNFPDSLSFQECAPKYLGDFPRIYSMSINGVEEASLTRSLWNYPISFLAVVSQVFALVFIMIWCMNINLAIKDLKKRKKKIDSIRSLHR